VFDPIRRLQRSTTLALALSPVGLILIAVTRLLIVSDYRVSTATAIVTSDGYLNTLLGSLLPIVPLLIPYLALLLLLSRRFITGLLALAAGALVSPLAYTRSQALHLFETDGSRGWDWAVGNLLMVLLAIVAAVLVLSTLLFGVAVFSRTVGVVLAVALVALVLVLYPLPVGGSYYEQLIKQPWLPEERITLHARPLVLGYVLADTDVAMEVLLQNGRSVVFYPNKLVVAQEICQAVPGSLRPLLPLTPSQKPAPPCDQRLKSRPSGGRKIAPTASTTPKRGNDEAGSDRAKVTSKSLKVPASTRAQGRRGKAPPSCPDRSSGPGIGRFVLWERRGFRHPGNYREAGRHMGRRSVAARAPGSYGGSIAGRVSSAYRPTTGADDGVRTSPGDPNSAPPARERVLRALIRGPDTWLWRAR
jgi:hypothetical protein